MDQGVFRGILGADALKPERKESSGLKTGTSLLSSIVHCPAITGKTDQGTETLEGKDSQSATVRRDKN